jgi:predicted RNase H-like HicB family nuclease
MTYNKEGFAMYREFNVVIERDADGFLVGSVPELRSCHTQAKSLDALMKRIQEAISLCLETQGNHIKTPEFVAVQRIAVNE